MDPTASIERLGFRKWYERELIRGHAALVTCFLCAVTVAALVEYLSKAGISWKALALVFVLAATCFLGWHSWRSYSRILLRAERYGESSNCPSCSAYGRFRVMDSGLDSIPDEAAQSVAPLESAWLKVQCRKCGTAWRMPS